MLIAEVECVSSLSPFSHEIGGLPFECPGDEYHEKSKGKAKAKYDSVPKALA